MRGVDLRAVMSGFARGVRRVRVRAVAAIANDQDTPTVVPCSRYKPLHRTWWVGSNGGLKSGHDRSRIIGKQR